MEETIQSQIIKRCEDLNSDNANWQSYYQELADFCLPRKGNIMSLRTRGEKLKMNHLYDATAIISLKIMSAGFHSNLTNPSSKWFNLRTRDIRLMKLHEVMMWFKEVEDIMYGTINSSNFDTTMQEFYLGAGCFGTGAILTLEDPKEKVRFTEIPIEQIVMEEDAYGRVNRMYRKFFYTVQQAYDLWGEKAGEAVTGKVKDKPNARLEFIHYVGPRDKYISGKRDGINMPFMSMWIEKSKKHLIGQGGFLEFPYSVGRFYKDTNDVMGFSPAMDALPWIKLVNAQSKTMLRASMKAADPALILPRRGFVLPLNANPSATNYHDSKVTADAIKQMPTSANIPITLEVIKQVKTDIEKAFFVPLFQALSAVTKQMTVPEVQRRIAENMILLGPVVGRFTQEVLDPIISRVFNILWRNSEIPEPPTVLTGQEMDIVYISPLAKAQRESEIYSIEAFLTDVSAIAQAKPGCLDKINEDNAVDVIAKVRGIDPSLIRSDSEIQAIRQQRAEEQAKLAQMQATQAGADVVQKGAGAVKDLAGANASQGK